MELKPEAGEPEGRRKTHGRFTATAEIAVMLAELTTPKTERPVGKHGREMICVKLARIAEGDPEHPDHWDDIAGYAALVAKDLRARAKASPPSPALPALREFILNGGQAGG